MYKFDLLTQEFSRVFYYNFIKFFRYYNGFITKLNS